MNFPCQGKQRTTVKKSATSLILVFTMKTYGDFLGLQIFNIENELKNQPYLILVDLYFSFETKFSE